MLFGCHVSIAGGVFNAPLNAAHLGCEVFQMFTRSPQGGATPQLTPEIVAMFKQNMKLAAQRECYIHTPYFINFASANNRIRYGSISVVREELERGSLLGATYVMTHLGSYKDLGKEAGFPVVVDGLATMLKDYKGTTEFLIEISAGAGEVIGHTFEYIAEIIHHPKLKKFAIGVCFDTQHAFASGYDIRTPEAVAETFNRFDATIGIERLKMFHCNDSKAEFNSHKDRHEHLGSGFIGRDGFAALLREPRLQNKNFILETEHDKVRDDLAVLFSLRKNVS